MKYIDKLITLRDKIQNKVTKNEGETHIAIIQGGVSQSLFTRELIDSLSKVTELVVYTTDSKSDIFPQAYADSLGIKVRMMRPLIRDGALFDELLDQCDLVVVDIRRLNAPELMEPIYYRMTDKREEVIPLEVGGTVADDDNHFYDKMLQFGKKLSEGEIEIKDNRPVNPLDLYVRDRSKRVSEDPLD